MKRAIRTLSPCGMRGLSISPAPMHLCTSRTWWCRPGAAAVTFSVCPPAVIDAVGDECEGASIVMTAFSHVTVDVRGPGLVDPHVRCAVAPSGHERSMVTASSTPVGPMSPLAVHEPGAPSHHHARLIG
jgi:hypothetical protein